MCKLSSHSNTEKNGNVPKRTSLSRRPSLTWVLNYNASEPLDSSRNPPSPWLSYGSSLTLYLWFKSVSVCRSIMYYRRSSFGNEPAQTLIIVETAANSTGTVDCFSLQEAGNRSHTEKYICFDWLWWWKCDKDQSRLTLSTYQSEKARVTSTDLTLPRPISSPHSLYERR